jgi:hypothetical protein
MPNIREVYRLLAPANNKAVKQVENQTTNDIILQVLKQHKSNAIEAKKIAHLFDGGNLYSTCEIIWNFLKYQVPYAVEPSDRQSTKTISRILYDALNNKGNDCKHYSGFTGAILDALGYKKDYVYRFAGYSNYHNTPTHVYVVANDNDGKIYCDAVISGFDLEKPYKIKIDKKPMSLYSLSGVDDTSILEPQVSGIFKKIKSVAKKVATPIAKAAKAVKQATVTTSLSLPRNAFLLLIKFNVHGWATGMQKLSWDELKWWANIGGDRTLLQKAIKEGATKKRILGLNDNDVLSPSMVNSIGEVVTVAGSLATAAPIIAKLTTVLEKAEKISNAVENIKGKVSKTKDAIDKGKAGFKALTGKDVSDVVFKKDAGKTTTKNMLDKNDLLPTSDADADRIAKALVNKKPMSNNLLLIGGGAALLGILLLNKK